MTTTFITGVWIPQTNGSGTDFKNDVVKFLNEYREDDLFKWVPGREHSAIPGFARDPTINNVVKLKARLKKYARKLDMYRALLP